MKVAPRSLFARDVLSIAYLQLGQLECALQVIGEMIVLDPINPGHHFKRAMLYQQRGAYEAAVTGYVRAMDMSLPESELHDDAAQALDALEDYQMGQIVMLAAEDKLFGIKLRRNVAEAIAERGFALSREGLVRMRHFTDEQWTDVASDLFLAIAPTGFRCYN